MTYQELQARVQALGFTSAPPPVDHMYQAASLALDEINLLSPLLEQVAVQQGEPCEQDVVLRANFGYGERRYRAHSLREKTDGRLLSTKGICATSADTEPFAARLTEAAAVRGEWLYLPDEFRGCCYVRCACAPQPLSEERPDAEITLATALLPLLPVLTAAYLWLDDEPEKAELYHRRYRELREDALSAAGVR